MTPAYLRLARRTSPLAVPDSRAMSEVRSFTVRPLSKQPRSDFKDAFRVYLSSSSLASLRLRAGDLCSLTSADAPPKTAIAWTPAETIQNTVVQTSRILQDCYGMKIGQKVAINRIDDTLEDIESVILVECSDPEKSAKYGDIAEVEKVHWEWALRYQLSSCETLAVGLIFDLELIRQRRSFQVTSIQTPNRSTPRTLFQFNLASSKISISGDTEEVVGGHDANIKVLTGSLGGLSRQIEEINESLSDFNLDAERLVMPSFYEPRRAILLYGPKGTGKTTLLQQIEKAGWKHIFKIGTSTLGRSVSEGEAKLRSTFQEAARAKPSVIIIDQLEFIAPKRTSDSQSLASVLCENLDALRMSSVLVVAATRHPNHVDDALRTPHRFATEIELQVPTAQDRAEILRAIRGPVCCGLSDGMIDLLAEKTHGYVGADLFALLQLVCLKARQRQLREPDFSIHSLEQSHPAGLDELSGSLTIQETDIVLSLQEIRPTAMREVFLETPKVRWSDIGGLHDIKRRLQKAVERPLKVSNASGSRFLLCKKKTKLTGL